MFVGLSGGVDSSVAAALLKERGFDVIGVHIRSYNIDGCGERDAEDARRVAEHLQIPFYVFDFEQEYKERVVQYMIDGYKRGITPNPDVMCNKEIKFGLFLEKALAMGAAFVATGHYVRRGETSDAAVRPFAHEASPRFFLARAKDANKDQSYFLWMLTQKQLRHALFPIGEYTKPEVRELAKKFCLPTAEKKDSQGVCFLGKVTIEDFLKEYIFVRRGAIMNERGEKIGEHDGAHFYTVGQRRIGAGSLLLPKGRAATPAHYVAAKDVGKNTVTFAAGEDNPALYKTRITLQEVNVLHHDARIVRNEDRAPVLARVRYRQPLVSAQLIMSDARYTIQFDEPVKFVAPGQSAVFYNADGVMLGGGIIERAS